MIELVGKLTSLTSRATLTPRWLASLTSVSTSLTSASTSPTGTSTLTTR
ncbi:MAG TPA: hypothetical protein VFX76_19250 [Roseiflexaceae bacterium]|nr:hypothetical protein [Roseiflexaceae bacterium]